jgi:hypothetical protein
MENPQQKWFFLTKALAFHWNQIYIFCVFQLFSVFAFINFRRYFLKFNIFHTHWSLFRKYFLINIRLSNWKIINTFHRAPVEYFMCEKLMEILYSLCNEIENRERARKLLYSHRSIFSRASKNIKIIHKNKFVGFLKYF